jgi:uncharacterized protein YeaO (DUF488 family)
MTAKKGSKTMINVKSIFASASDDDGFRILVEPVWPKKAPHGKMVTWLRYLTPSPELYNQFASDMITWEDFIVRYHSELDQVRTSLRELQVFSRNGGLTLLYGSGTTDHNTAVALKMFFEKDPEWVRLFQKRDPGSGLCIF